MFNDLINLHDVVILFRKLRQGHAARLLRGMAGSHDDRVKGAWKHTTNATSHWWEIPAVLRRWNSLITGDPSCSYQSYTHARYLAEKHSLTGISLGCGSGVKEIEWVRTSPNLRLTGYDISAERIALARTYADEHRSSDRLRFEPASVYDLAFPEASLDLIITDGALHHFHSLEVLLPRFRHWMNSGGLLIVNDFIGPARFQWTDMQLKAVQQALEMIPVKYRTDRFGRVKKKVYRPGRLSMMISDPSEAVESDRIDILLRRHFSIIDHKPYGGTLLQLVFKEIAHHFIEPDDEAQRVMQQLFDYEDSLLREGKLHHDFSYYLCGKL